MTQEFIVLSIGVVIAVAIVAVDTYQQFKRHRALRRRYKDGWR